MTTITAAPDSDAETIARLTRERDEARAALKPFARLASTWTVETAALNAEILILTNGRRMCGIEAQAFLDARAALPDTPSHKAPE